MKPTFQWRYSLKSVCYRNAAGGLSILVLYFCTWINIDLFSVPFNLAPKQFTFGWRCAEIPEWLTHLITIHLRVKHYQLFFEAGYFDHVLWNSVSFMNKIIETPRTLNYGIYKTYVQYKTIVMLFGEVHCTTRLHAYFLLISVQEVYYEWVCVTFSL